MVALSTLSMGCGKMHDLLDTPEKLDKMLKTTEGMATTTGDMKKGMDSTNESIRMQKLSISLTELLKKENREYLSPLPGLMLPPGKVLAESLTVEEALLFVKDFVTKINEEQFVDRHPGIAPESPEYPTLLAQFEKEKLGDLMMLKIVSGYLPEKTVDALIQQESEQGAYRDELYQILMFRVQFYDDLMLAGSIFKVRVDQSGRKVTLDTLGRIEKAMEYTAKIKFVEALPFRDLILVKIKGFKDDETNETYSAKLDGKRALKNYKKIKEKAEKDFTATSYSSGDNTNELQKQKARFEQLMAEIKKEIESASPVP